MTSGPTHSKMASDIWSVADLLRGDYKRHEYGQVILPFTLLRRLDSVMAPTREAVWDPRRGLEMQNKQRLLEICRQAAVLQHLEAGLPDDRRRRAERREEPARLHQRLLRQRPARSWTASTCTTRSPGWRAPSSSTGSSAGSRT